MRLLVVDTATEACVAAVCEVSGDGAGPSDGAGEPRVLAARAPVDARRHGELLAPLIAEVLDESATARDALGGVVVGLGPGPFTSLRVGVVTAAAFADALGLRAVGVCTLDGIGCTPEATATAGSGSGGSGAPVGSVVVATDARRREVYWARYADGRRVEGPDVARPAVLAEALAAGEPVLGSGGVLAAELTPHAAPGPRFPDPATLARVALPALLAADEPGPLVPLYLRRPDATPSTATAREAAPARTGAT